MRQIPLLTFLILAACSSPARQTAGDTGRLDVTIELDSDGSARITEHLKLSAKKPGAARLTRNIHVQPISFLAVQEVRDLTLVDAQGRRVPLRTRAYGEWVNADFGNLGADADLTLRYSVYPFFPDRGSFRWVAVGLFWHLTLTETTIRLIDGSKSGYSNLAAKVNFSDCETCRFKPADDGFTLTAGSPIPAGSTLELTGKRDRPAPEVDTLLPMVRQNWPYLAWFTLMLAGSLMALFLGARGRNRTIRVLNWALLIPISLVLFHATRYWLHELPVRPGELDSMIGEFLWNPAVLALVAAFIGYQNRSLARWEKKSWFLQHGVFLVSLAVLPVPTSGVWFVPLGALVPLLFWSRKSTATWFGAGLFEVAEHVRSVGETTLNEASARFRIPPAHLAFLLSRERHAALVFDPKAEKLISAENARLLQNVQVCPHCGGADLVTRGAGHAACGFCGREYVSSFAQATAERPVPVLIEAVASFFGFLAGVLGALGLLVGTVFFVIGVTAGEGPAEASVLALFTMAVFALLTWRTAVFSRDLREGVGLGKLKFWMVLGIPAVVPLMVLLKLSSRRIQLHFGRLEPGELETELRKGPMDLPALARWLKTDAADAADAAAYLCGNHLIDAIYDRRQARVAHLDLYRSLATRDVCCLRCGGTLGILDGVVRCQFCGAQPDGVTS
ncbi:hypothetical protein KKD52_00170 [Myxococcota bacterium]|nr:hypothetical protein [Myxococcota bacterium]MBU1411866.1 hypothetical protein [Myxococcota bacterium]MBU1508745.1 hypothetical protein [Myxococcota bacterium]